MDINREDIAWAAGLFEGEGSISWSRHKNRYRPDGECYHTLQMSLHSTDEDVVRKFAKIIGVGKVHGPYRFPSPEVPNRKPSWYWGITSHERCQAVIAMLWPWLCSRRKAKAKETLALEVLERPKGKQHHRNTKNGRFDRT